MNTENAHILTKYGVLSNFHIVRKIKSSFINGLKRKYKKQGLSAKETKKKINEDILSYTEKFLSENNIPGLIYEDHHNDSSVPEIDDKIRDKIVKLSEYCERYTRKNKLNKDHIILFMQLFLHTLHITNDDIVDFKNRFNINDENNSDQNEDDDDDYV